MNDNAKPLVIVLGTLLLTVGIYVAATQYRQAQEKSAANAARMFEEATKAQERMGEALAPFVHGQDASTRNGSEGYRRARDTLQRDMETVIEISALDLGQAYVENQLHADRQYRNKVLRVRGKLVSVMRDGGHIYGQGDVILTLGFGTVICSLRDSEIAKAQNLPNGQIITVQGYNVGGSMTPVLADCTIL